MAGQVEGQAYLFPLMDFRWRVRGRRPAEGRATLPSKPFTLGQFRKRSLVNPYRRTRCRLQKNLAISVGPSFGLILWIHGASGAGAPLVGTLPMMSSPQGQEGPILSQAALLVRVPARVDHALCVRDGEVSHQGGEEVQRGEDSEVGLVPRVVSVSGIDPPVPLGQAHSSEGDRGPDRVFREALHPFGLICPLNVGEDDFSHMGPEARRGPGQERPHPIGVDHTLIEQHPKDRVVEELLDFLHLGHVRHRHEGPIGLEHPPSHEEGQVRVEVEERAKGLHRDDRAGNRLPILLIIKRGRG